MIETASATSSHQRSGGKVYALGPVPVAKEHRRQLVSGPTHAQRDARHLVRARLPFQIEHASGTYDGRDISLGGFAIPAIIAAHDTDDRDDFVLSFPFMGYRASIRVTARYVHRDRCEPRSGYQICDIDLAIMLETYREDYVLKKTAEAESLAVMGKLTAGLAHEVRNPLNAAKLQLDVLRRNSADIQDSSIRRKIERRTNLVQDELRRLSLLLDDFLNLARARSLDPVRCDACELLTEALTLRERIGDAYGSASSLGSLGFATLESGRPGAALGALARAESIFERGEHATELRMVALHRSIGLSMCGLTV